MLGYFYWDHTHLTRLAHTGKQILLEYFYWDQIHLGEPAVYVKSVQSKAQSIFRTRLIEMNLNIVFNSKVQYVSSDTVWY